MTDQRLSPQNASPADRLVAGGVGAGLILLSVRRTGTAGLIMGTSGALLFAGAAMGRSVGAALTGIRRTKQNSVAVQQAVTIGVSPDDLYAFWRDFTNLPRFMTHLTSVQLQGPGGVRSRWVARAPAGTHVHWDAEITEDQPGRRIAWRSVDGAQVPNEGHVTFRPAPADRGTEVQVALTYHPPGGTMGAALARLLGEEPAVQIAADLRRLKRLLEVGEEPSTEGQSSARHGPLKTAEARLYDRRRTS